MKVCFAVNMRLVAIDGDVMNKNWNATTPESCRNEDVERPQCANRSGKKRATRRGGADYVCAVLRTW